ncbi:glycoside hydrolase family 2 [Luteibacter aegosomaticola]|uniref:glycosyl hydrolase 2 galactose-binding domain-containing protein n=1 Tax=Luteibacter aegosomaticola TaxID=2911538 RepID=UPI001FF8F1D7|nr:glycoside hydrolase family 2 TIM barrel-domain containing protein [Luteibacter aegosomaticola]UPG90760.1 glycoside hydrolase family 2 [Luteibacter aegosomaticola]
MPTAARTAFAAAILLGFSCGEALAAHATYADTRVPAEPGSVSPINRWEIQDTAKAQEDGAAISARGFATKEWFPVTGRATVMAGLLENDVFKNDVFYSDNLRAVQVPDASGTVFVTPWWYRAGFDLSKAGGDRHTLLRTHGIIASADLWVNGQKVADHADIAGAYPVRDIEVTRWVRSGANAVAFKVYPADPRMSLSIGWVDWNPTPPDNNMGPWRGVDIVQTGPVALSAPLVLPTLSADLKQATLTVKVTASNLDTAAHDVTVSGTVADKPVQQKVHLGPGEVKVVSLAAGDTPAVTLDNPKVWWPIGMGDHPLYAMSVTANVDGTVSDRAATSFGVRRVESNITPQGYRQFTINGQPLLIRGGGWAPDMFLRDDPARMKAEFDYVVNLGINTIRSEGKLENDRFYDLADRHGILILAGWECCDKWEAAAKTGGQPWNDADMRVAQASMASEARLLRNHPSVIGFFIGSDHAPPPPLAKMYTDTLRAEDWTLPVISAAVDEKTAEAGPSGMKMAGPYDWIPPSYWYADQYGGAFGFDSEVSAGAVIPRLEDVQRMLSPQEQEALWKYPEARQYHASADWSTFAVLTPFDNALAHRYGTPTGLADYVAKAQLDNYDNVRAQFEAFNAHMNAAKPATGVIYWMLNNAWPSLHWHLYDYYMNPAGAYYGAKKGNEPLHIQYSYDTHDVVVVNHTLDAQHALQARIRVRNLDGSVRFEKQVPDIDLAGNHAQSVLAIPAVKGLTKTYFVELDLASADGKPVSRNVYWLSTQADELDWAKSNWYLTPVTKYGDLTALASLPKATREVRVSTIHDGSDEVTTVTLAIPASSPAAAIQEHLSIRRGARGELALPVRWTDNDITLWPGESIVLTARYPAQGGAGTVVEVAGWNAPVAQYTAGVTQGKKH